MKREEGKKKKAIMILLLVFFLTGAYMFGLEFDIQYPEFNPDVTTFFKNESRYYTSLLFEEYDISNSYLTVFFPHLRSHSSLFSKDDISTLGLSLQYTWYIPINDFLYIPVYGAITPMLENDIINGVEVSNNQWSSLLGSGLLFNGDVGTIAFYAGWNYNYVEIVTGEDRYWGETEELQNNHKLYLSLIPIINTSKFPIIGLVFSAIDATLGFNKDGISNKEVDLLNNYLIKPVFRRLDFDSFSINAKLFYQMENAGIFVKRETYGANIFLEIGELAFFLDAGYHRFHGVKEGSRLYHDTVYVNIMYVMRGLGGNAAFGLYFDRDHLFPTLRVIGGGKYFNGNIELGIIGKMSVTIGIRWLIGY